MAAAKSDSPSVPFSAADQDAIDRAKAQGADHVSIAGTEAELQELAKVAKANGYKSSLGPIGYDGRGKLTLSLEVK